MHQRAQRVVEDQQLVDSGATLIAGLAALRAAGRNKAPPRRIGLLAVRAQLADQPLRAIPFVKGPGCDTCSGTGYKGRAGLYEVMAMSPELRRMILRGASVSDMQEQAVTEGMLTLRMDGMKKVERGVTTLEEVVKETAG